MDILLATFCARDLKLDDDLVDVVDANDEIESLCLLFMTASALEVSLTTLMFAERTCSGSGTRDCLLRAFVSALEPPEGVVGSA